jgi:hypothetical protein
VQPLSLGTQGQGLPELEEVLSPSHHFYQEEQKDPREVIDR